MITTRAPGKLFIVGEYAVVEAGEPAVLVAVNRYLHVRLREQSEPAQHSEGPYVDAAIRVIDELRADRGLAERYFTLETESELEDESGRKYGLGSSAAVTVATIAALDRLYGLNLDPLERLKLALIATVEVSPRASGGDLAASTVGGWVYYRAPDRAALHRHRAEHGLASALACSAWESFEVRRLSPPNDTSLLIGWTGSPASTQQLVDRVSPAGAASHQQYAEFLAQSRSCVESFAHELDTAGPLTLQAIHEARSLLRRLGSIKGIAIETDALRDLCDIAERHGATAKPSGAGGGDCGIALVPTDLEINELLQEWEQHGIRQLHLEVHDPLSPGEGGSDAR